MAGVAPAGAPGTTAGLLLFLAWAAVGALAGDFVARGPVLPLCAARVGCLVAPFGVILCFFIIC